MTARTQFGFKLVQESLKLEASGSEAGESEESLPVDYEGKELKIGFNSQYLLDFMSVAETELVELRVTDNESAGQLQLNPEPEGYSYRLRCHAPESLMRKDVY